MDNGVLQQYDAPLRVYSHPDNLFVADFVGNPAINFIEAKGTEEKAEQPEDSGRDSATAAEAGKSVLAAD